MSVNRTLVGEAQKRDRRAVYAGTLVTGVSTLFLFVLPDLLPVDAFGRWYLDLTGAVVQGNPFTSLRFCGGLVGGAVGGWLVSDLGSGAIIGLKAALYGLVAISGPSRSSPSTRRPWSERFRRRS